MQVTDDLFFTSDGTTTAATLTVRGYAISSIANVVITEHNAGTDTTLTENTDYTLDGDAMTLTSAIDEDATLTWSGSANFAWPSTLPQPLQSGTTLAPLTPNVITTNVETGAPKYRRRFTVVPDKYTTTLSLTGDQVTTLKDFVANACHDVLPFDWYDPVTQDTNTYVFTQRPTYSYDQGGYDSWTASLTLQAKP